PLFAYDIPVAVHTKLPRDVVLGLAADGTLAGLKDSSGDEGSLRRLLVELRPRTPDFSVLTGSELTVDASARGYSAPARAGSGCSADMPADEPVGGSDGDRGPRTST
ncbi:hypothetical protein ACFWE2_21915, partial [Promicromonospora sp. NPDC060271]